MKMVKFLGSHVVFAFHLLPFYITFFYLKRIIADLYILLEIKNMGVD